MQCAINKKNKWKMNSKNYSILMSIGLLGGLIKVWRETSMISTVQVNWGKLFSPVEILAISAYILLFLVGFSFLFMGLWRVETLNRATLTLKLKQMGWLMLVVVILIPQYVYLYSEWQNILVNPWIQFMFAMSFAQVALFLVGQNRAQRFGWSELALALSLFLYPRIVQETRSLTTDTLSYRIVTITGFAVVVFIIFALYSPYSERIRFSLIAWREKIGAARLPLMAVLCLAPILHRYLVAPETYILYDDIRFAILLAAVWNVAYLALTGSDPLVTREALGISLGVLLFTSVLAQYSLEVINYPFSLSWSEGNRFYDYSLVFGQSLYNHVGKIANPYELPGRYGLWGILFLLKGLPIWVHRLWNLILLTVPVLIFSALLTRKLKPPALRYGMLLWIALFLTIRAPLHPPFIVVSIITVLFAFDNSFVKRGASLAVAGFYAGLSRWTWAFAPGAIGALIDLLLYYPARTGPWWKRLAPTAALTLLGVLPGLLPSAGLYSSLVQGESVTSNQPLLLYRLFPNEILGLGVLFLALLYTLPLLLILGWWIKSKQWQLDRVQITAMGGALTGFFVIGLVISAKIGGGGDLHNLDMYLVTVLTLSVLGLTVTTKKKNLPVWALGLVLYLVYLMVYPFTPFNPVSTYDPRLDLANQNQVKEALTKIQKRVKAYTEKGEVLFMDQRQLLTFGFVTDVPFVPEYEKKYMMDQAMGNNAQYFHSYYEDLAAKRFTLIVTEPLRSELKDEMGGAFAEENDAWVTWVSNPTLCYYEPIYLSKKTNVELLVPKKNPVGCEQYLE